MKDHQAYIKQIIRYLRSMADPPESFTYRQKNHYVFSLILNQKRIQLTVSKTPSGGSVKKKIAADIRREFIRVGAIFDPLAMQYLSTLTPTGNSLAEQLLLFLDEAALADERGDSGASDD
jgi:hypothetical protein|tara:strand:- start:336 stop:695 length:360 start_codon:yes stop_codon:yes gene_type:complete